MIQIADVAPLPNARTQQAAPYFPDEPIHLTHSERMRVYSTAWFDLGCFALLALLLCAALFA